MAESLADRLKRIAAEKKAAREQEPTEAAPAPKQEPVEETSNGPVRSECLEGSNESEQTGDSISRELSCTGTEASSEMESSDNSVQPSNRNSDHPLAMQFAELEQMLLARDPQFKTILRQVHKHLGQDAELVTQMTEEEISLIVGGLVLFANTEIVEPAKAKSAKAAVAKASKVKISADDL